MEGLVSGYMEFADGDDRSGRLYGVFCPAMEPENGFGLQCYDISAALGSGSDSHGQTSGGIAEEKHFRSMKKPGIAIEARAAARK